MYGVRSNPSMIGGRKPVLGRLRVPHRSQAAVGLRRHGPAFSQDGEDL
jgi:hypothetical protein